MPFNAAFTTVFVGEGNFPIDRITVLGQGQAIPLGTATAATTNQLVNLQTGEATATYTFGAANGDTFVLEEKFQSTFDQMAGRVTFEGTYVVTGGTGRFAGATDSGTLSGSAVFTGPNDGIGSFTLLGTISSPGSLK